MEKIRGSQGARSHRGQNDFRVGQALALSDSRVVYVNESIRAALYPGDTMRSNLGRAADQALHSRRA